MDGDVLYLLWAGKKKTSEDAYKMRRYLQTGIQD